MLKNKKLFIILFLFSIGAIVVFSKYSQIYALSKYGSQGNEVRQIQEKLKRWGYYNGTVDGIFGSKTLAAVKSFQKKND